MSKKGGSNHFVRMRASKNIGVISRKKVKWLLAPAPGTHKKSESISAGVLLRDVLGRASSIHEVKRILRTGGLLIDGKKISEPKYPVGVMDIISEPAEKKAYRMSLDSARLVPKEVKGEAATRKYLKVTGKNTAKGGKITIAFHDGRNQFGDKHIGTGDTCVFSIPGFKLLSHIKLAPGVTCLVMKGKHMGEVAKLEKIIERPGSHDTEAHLTGASGEFITVRKYLFAVDGNY
ncbi:MAG: S4 domain-containing protein [Candidatus Micrarchaeota archaeon]|nr:S4 domain-containing protein [Candidatus Micrarchaeota archaeon]